MRLANQIILAATLILLMTVFVCVAVTAQTAPAASPAASAPSAALPSDYVAVKNAPTASPAVSPLPLLEFDEADIKFNLAALMRTLRDPRHEGWVLAAYPDPKTSRPLIGAGFSLDVEAREHPQNDPLNPHPFVEPSSAQLWQAAGLDALQLQAILEQFERNLQKWGKKGYRKKIRAHTLSPQITEDQATRLLRISAVQAIYNARAYCRNFDQLSASQQMALSQLVFQMGVNLEEFTQFLAAVNQDASLQNAALRDIAKETESERWRVVQQTLIESQWARRYSSRAISVIAMFDAAYAQSPAAAEKRVQAVLRPPAKKHHKKAHAAAARAANHSSSITAEYPA